MVTEHVGKYEVLAALTEGGMAQLFLGATAGPGGFRKYVVIKRVLPTAVGDENFERMFLDEARVTAAFSHPAIAQVFDLGEDEQGLYVVMEFIAGQNLNQVVYTCAKQRAVLPLGYSVAVVHECALALHYAHTFKDQTGEESPVIHRDVAQKNIMVTYDGQVKLLDFGIAKVKNALSKTKAGTVKGTAGYMSPEQVRGEPLDARSDVFSLGVVLWEMVTGRRLFSANTEIEELRMILECSVTSPTEIEPSVPVELSHIVLKALSADRSQRFGSARDFARALQTACDFLYDADARAEFMRERFEAKIASARELFEVAASTSADEVNRAVKNYQRHSGTESEESVVTTKRRQRTNLSEGKLAPVRKPRTVSKPKVRAASVPDEAIDEEELSRQIERAARGSSPPATRSAMPTVLLVVLVLLGASGSAWYLFSKPRFVEEPPLPVATLDAIPLAPVEQPEPLPPPPPKPEKTPPRSPSHAQGEVRLALIPEAKVSLGSQALAEGAMVNFSLPVGTHLLTVVGQDGIKHVLSLPVVAGKNPTQKFHLDQLPVK